MHAIARQPRAGDKGQNDRAGNLDFARKLEVYFNTPGAPAPILNEDLRGRTEWKAVDIKAREARLVRLIEELWQIELQKLREQTQEGAVRQSNPKRRRA